MNSVNLKVEKGIATITIDNPKTLNAITVDVIKELRETLVTIKNDDEIKVVVITGENKVFSSGGDIGSFATMIKNGETIPEAGVIEIGEVVSQIREIPKPFIAAINGVAAGAGCSIALACDYRIMVEGAKFIEAFINLALSGDSGSLFFLNELVGYGKTTEIMGLGQPISTEEAKNMGLLTKVVPVAEFDEMVSKFAMRIANGPLSAYACQKELINHLVFGERFKKYLELEAKCMVETSKSEDFKEGVMAFLEKRHPQFRGK